LNFIEITYDHLDPNGKCVYLKKEDDKHLCAIHTNKPTQCNSFPFSLKKENEIGYRLVIHAECSGFGQGNLIDIKDVISNCITNFNREFNKQILIDFTPFYKDLSVYLNE
jgi:Fe-S-cluster containining protein